MNQDRQESRKERLERLLKKNKIKLAREKLLQTYKHDLHYEIVVDQFVDLERSNSLLHLVYKKAQLQSKPFVHYQSIVDEIHVLEKSTHIDSYTTVIFYYLDTLKAGGVKIPFKDGWELIERIGNTPRSDIIVVEEDAAFGLCIELEEHSYSLVHWGMIKAL